MRTPVPKRTPAPPAIIHGDCVVVMSMMSDESIDAIVTDPPYGLEFMGKEWDRLGAGRIGVPGIGARETPWVSNRGWNEKRCRSCGHLNHGGSPCSCDTPDVRVDPSRWQAMQAWHEQWAREAFRVLKPGGHLLAFGGTRTFHRLTCALEDTGFEIRDCLMWLYGQGFPKSPNLGDGRGTALKPAWEPIVLVRKPVNEPNVAANVLKYGTGALNIDACRIATDHNPSIDRREAARRTGHAPVHGRSHREAEAEGRMENRSAPEVYAADRPSERLGRWPANAVLDEDTATLLDEQSAAKMYSAGSALPPQEKWRRDHYNGVTGWGGNKACGARFGDFGGASRFFYVAKASQSERTMNGRVENKHPTVKPIALMRWLLRLVTPSGGLVLDPFAGSGSTVLAGVVEQIDVLGIEQDITTVETARARLAITERETKDPPAG